MNPCQVPGCKEHTRGGRYYCESHHKAWLASPELRQAQRPPAGHGNVARALHDFEARVGHPKLT